MAERFSPKAPTNIVAEAIAHNSRSSIGESEAIEVGWGEVVGMVAGGAAGFFLARRYPMATINFYGTVVGASLGATAAYLIKKTYIGHPVTTNSNPRRLGQPKTDIERAADHFGVPPEQVTEAMLRSLPYRGTGLTV